MSYFSDFFISTAHAQTAQDAAQQGGGSSFIIMTVVLILFMYFAMWRPQSKRAKEQQTLLDSLAQGDEVQTSGGMVGRIEKIHAPYITLSIANNVNVIMQRNAVMSVLPKGTIKNIA